MYILLVLERHRISHQYSVLSTWSSSFDMSAGVERSPSYRSRIFTIRKQSQRFRVACVDDISLRNGVTKTQTSSEKSLIAVPTRLQRANAIEGVGHRLPFIPASHYQASHKLKTTSKRNISFAYTCSDILCMR